MPRSFRKRHIDKPKMKRIAYLFVCWLSTAICRGGESASAAGTEPRDSRGGSVPLSATTQRRGETTPRSYHCIVERNIFGLSQPVSASPAASPKAASPANLFLTGVATFLARPQAFFAIAEPGKASSGFILREGEQNEWLEVQSVDMRNRTVKARLNKSLTRIGTIGTEVILSFEQHGVNAVKRELGPHVPSPAQLSLWMERCETQVRISPHWHFSSSTTLSNSFGSLWGGRRCVSA